MIHDNVEESNNKELIANNNNENTGKDGANEVAQSTDLWADLDAKSLLKLRKEVFSVIVDALEDVDMDANKKATSLSIYSEAAEALDTFARVFKQSKQDVVSVAILEFVKRFTDNK